MSEIGFEPKAEYNSGLNLLGSITICLIFSGFIVLVVIFLILYVADTDNE